MGSGGDGSGKVVGDGRCGDDGARDGVGDGHGGDDGTDGPWCRQPHA